eukprot:CAMPEP_0170515948 /NCGR_PEP_ID=MMETSP0209-20121228/2317_1 /TAXON_ID=665100 ORGANISM="Litonotus pictus, Strain P1" /NCGR_SAMPLE_ID=MMETSP0209 /ASSEMBLY_ACC=CAM_ASM_000301 /LENGTH=310 /DNA_ID=CAMNT_0010800665 /DNA_START=1532 /DNA_END=2464 /DNA_ORIENTATION=+
MGFLEKYYNKTDTKFSSYQYLKHQTIYPGTLANIGAAYWGTFNKNNGVSVLKKFRDSGYIMGSTQNLCLAEMIDIKTKDPTKYEFVPDDHDFWTPFCDPNQENPKSKYTDFKGPYSILKKCMWEKQSVEHSLEYARQFFRKYKDNNKVFRFGTADSHETSAEVIKYHDEPVTSFLEELEADGTLEDTTVLIFSDHGTYSHGWLFRYLETDDWVKEEKLPGMFALIPKKVKYFDLIDRNMRSKENTMTTAFDIYKTLISTIDGKEEKESFKKYGNSLFYSHKNETESFDCKFYGTRDYVCMCRPLHNVTNY